MGISTHVLDTAVGLPAAGVAVSLCRETDAGWEEIGHGATDADGRCRDLYVPAELQRGLYRVRFETGRYFAKLGTRCLYPFVEIVIEVSEDRHYHVPLLLAANGYTTYRGS